MRGTEWWIVGAAVAMASPAFAQSTAPSAPTVASAETPAEDDADPTRDVVELRSGAMIRGLLLERRPDGAVRVRTVTGEVRTYAATEIAYAGPASARERVLIGPAAPAGLQTASALAPMPGVDVRFDLEPGERRSLEVAFAAAAPLRSSVFGTPLHTWTPLCVVPCAARVPAHVDAWRVGLLGRGGLPVDDAPSELRAGDVLRVRFRDAAPTRTAGWVTAASGLGLGLVGLVVGVVTAPRSDSSGVIAAGVFSGTGFVAAIAGVITVFAARDSATLDRVVGAPAGVPLP